LQVDRPARCAGCSTKHALTQRSNVSYERKSFFMTCEQALARGLLSVEASGDFSAAVMRFLDGSRLDFCHRVGERWVKAFGRGPEGDEPGLAAELLAAVAMFRLNAKHLDIEFTDGSRWDHTVPVAPV
jgi:hypothetical protein